MLAALALVLMSDSAGFPPDRLALSFAFFGCNRVESANWQAETNPASANVPQLRRTFQDILGCKPIPRFVFVGGDLVIGYADDGGKNLRTQLEGWGNLVRADPLWSRTTLIPIPGNHELDIKIGKERRTSRVAITIWNEWYRKGGFRAMASNGPREGDNNPDRVMGDQSQLSYSFNEGTTHFLVLNTDTAMLDDEGPAKVPIRWAVGDIEKAQTDSKIKSIFVMGHRNLADPRSCSGDSPIEPVVGKKLLQAIQSSPKVKAYVCAHVHAWDVVSLGCSGGARQVIAGNGGSKLEDDWKPQTGTYFGFALFEIYESGKVVLKKFSRPTPPEPQPYFTGVPVSPPPATVESTVLYDPVK